MSSAEPTPDASPGPALSPIPRLSLARRVAERMSEAILRGEWRGALPGERRLCTQMGVSRPVMREALQQLEERGLIDCAPNRPRTILEAPPSQPRQPDPMHGGRRVLLLFGSDHQTALDDPFLFSAITALEKRGIQLEVRPHGAVYALHRGGFFEQETVTILLSVPHSIQRWYQQRGYPALVLGSVYPGIDLSSVDVDSRATAHHAVGNLLRLGHRRITCISVDRPRAGDLEAEDGFTRAMAAREGTVAEIVRPRIEPDDVVRRLKRFLAARERPTALFISHAPVAVTVASYAVEAGVGIPRDLSLVCRDASLFLRFFQPRIAAYRANDAAAIRQVIRWIAAPPAAVVRKRFLADFEPGGSISGVGEGGERIASRSVS